MTKPAFIPLKPHGLVFDLKPSELPPDRWSNGRNVFFMNGDMYRCEGIGRIFTGNLVDVDIAWYVDTGAQEWWYYASSGGIGVTDGAGNHWNVTPATGWVAISAKNFVLTAGDLNSVPWINHPQVAPYYHDGNPTHKFVKLPDWPSGWTARVMAAHKNFLMAMCIDTGTGLLESQVSWSSSADPGQIPSYWVPSPTNDAGDWSFASPGGPIVGGISLRDQFFISKQTATAALQYVGGQFVFQARDVFPTEGLYAPNALIEHDNMVYMLSGNGEFIRHDGNSVQNFLYGVAQNYLINTINPEFPASVFLYMTDQTNVLAVGYPTGTTKFCTEALGVELASIDRDGGPDVGLRDLPSVLGARSGFTDIVPTSWDTASGPWSTDTQTWNETPSGYRPQKVVFAGGSGGFLELGRTDTVVGASIDAFAERMDMDFGDFSVHKVLSGCFPRLSGNSGDSVSFRFGGNEQAGTVVTWGTPVVADAAATRQLDFFQDGRMIAFQVSSSGGGPWRMSGMQLLARKGGRW